MSVPTVPESEFAATKTREHPLFQDPSADYTLRSKDGVLFKVHRLVLRLTSEFFRDMFALDTSTPDPDAPIPILGLDDDADSIDAILRIISGLPMKPIPSLDVAEPLIDFCDKYSMDGTMSIIRAVIHQQEGTQDALRLYKIASRYGWEEEAQLITPQCLRYNMTSPETMAAIQGLSLPHYMRLLNLVERRCDAFQTILDDSTRFEGSSHTCYCQTCGQVVHDLSWKWLKLVLVLELRKCPAGDTIRNKLSKWPAMIAMSQAAHCTRHLYSAEGTKNKIIKSLDELPMDLISHTCSRTLTDVTERSG